MHSAWVQDRRCASACMEGSPAACVMAIPGYAFDVNADLSGRAMSHLERAAADLLLIAGRLVGMR